jgi:hypothetical protein
VRRCEDCIHREVCDALGRSLCVQWMFTTSTGGRQRGQFALSCRYYRAEPKPAQDRAEVDADA